MFAPNLSPIVFQYRFKKQGRFNRTRRGLTAEKPKINFFFAYTVSDSASAFEVN